MIAGRDTIRGTWERLNSDPRDAIAAELQARGHNFAQELPEFAKANYFLDYAIPQRLTASAVAGWRHWLGADPRTAGDIFWLEPRPARAHQADLTQEAPDSGAVELSGGGAAYLEFHPPGPGRIDIAMSSQDVGVHVRAVGVPAGCGIDTTVLASGTAEGHYEAIGSGCDLVTLIAAHTDVHAGRATLEWQVTFSHCASGAGTALPTTGLVAHYDAGALDLSDGADVGSWPDSGPNGYDLAAYSPDKPAAVFVSAGTLNGCPAVRRANGPDGDSSPLTAQFDARSDPGGTIVLVTDSVEPTPSVLPSVWSYHQQSGHSPQPWLDTHEGPQMVYWTQDAGTQWIASTDPADNQRRLFIATVGDDVAAIEAGCDVIAQDAVDTTAGVAWDRVYVDGSDYDIFEIAIYDHALSPGDIDQIRAYYDSKYALGLDCDAPDPTADP